MKRELEERPVIQLSHYREFTDAIMEKCKVLYREAVSSLEKDVDQLIERLMDIDSPWLHLRPDLSKQEVEAGDVTKVRVQCDVDAFVDKLVVRFLYRIPSPAQLQNLHVGVTVGAETEEGLVEFERLQAHREDIKRAMDGICRPLSIDDDELRRIQADHEASL